MTEKGKSSADKESYKERAMFFFIIIILVYKGDSESWDKKDVQYIVPRIFNQISRTKRLNNLENCEFNSANHT